MQKKRLEITYHSTKDLIPDPSNLRLHPARNHQAVMDSIKAFGIRKPVVAHEGSKIVYAGNETLACAIELGYEEIPVAWIPKEVPPEKCKAYAVADNRTTDLSVFDDEALSEFLMELPELEIDPEIVGFNQEEFEALTQFFDIDQTDYPNLPEGERNRFVQRMFTLSTSQAETVDRIIKEVKAKSDFEGLDNENSNGNALYLLACHYESKSS